MMKKNYDESNAKFHPVSLKEEEKLIKYLAINKCALNKLTDIVPLYKTDNPLDKENYRPVSLLSHVSKIFQNVIYTWMETFIS